MTLGQGAEVPTCQFCGARLVFRGQTSCQACGRTLPSGATSTATASTPPAPAPAAAPAPAPSPAPAPALAATTLPPAAPAAAPTPPSAKSYFESFSLPAATPLAQASSLADQTAPAAATMQDWQASPASSAPSAEGIGMAPIRGNSAVQQPAAGPEAWSVSGPTPQVPAPLPGTWSGQMPAQPQVPAPLPGTWSGQMPAQPQVPGQMPGTWSAPGQTRPPFQPAQPTQSRPGTRPAPGAPARRSGAPARQTPRENPYSRNRPAAPGGPPSGGRTWDSQGGAWWPAQNQAPRNQTRSSSSAGAWIAIGIIAVVLIAIVAGASMNTTSNDAYPPATDYTNFYTPVALNSPFAVETLAGVAFPATDPLVPVASMQLPRANHTATLLPDGRVVIAGGVTIRDSLSNSTDTLASVEIYDPATRTFSADGALGTGRSFHTATLLKDGTILLVGGKGTDGRALDSAEVFDPKTGKSSPTKPMSTARISASAVLLDDGTVLIVGGSDGTNMLKSAEIYDPSMGYFRGTSSFILGNGYVTATMLKTGDVLVAGGSSKYGDLGWGNLYDPMSGAFKDTAS